MGGNLYRVHGEDQKIRAVPDLVRRTQTLKKEL